MAIVGAATLLLHFSSAVSRLSDQSDTLAQRQALLEERLRHQEAAQDNGSTEPAQSSASLN